MNYRWLALVIVVIQLTQVFVSSSSPETITENNESSGHSVESVTKPRALPKIFDFTLFARLYHRYYGGPLETLKRKAIYLANSLKVFFRNVLWARRKSHYYYKISPYTDFTEEEIRKLYQHIGPTPNEGAHKTVGIDEHQLKHVVDDIIESHVPGVSDVIAEELEERIDGQKSSRLVDHKENDKDIRHVPIEIGQEFQLPLSPKTVDDVLPSEENPDYHRPEIKKLLDEEASLAPVPLDLKTLKENSKAEVATFISRTIDKLFSLAGDDDDNIKSIDDGQRSSDISQSPSAQLLMKRRVQRVPDRVYWDWGLSDCMTPPKSQRSCGSCWAFAGTAILEFEHCLQTGRLVSFSEQYHIDCSLTFDPDNNELNGCDGGNMSNLPELINHFGVELSRIYPYIGKHGNCPYSNDTTTETKIRKGHLRPKVLKQTIHQREPGDSDVLWHIVRYVDQGPVLTGVAVPADFHLYGGGVYTGETCREDESHAMVAVGHGIEDGIEYWLLRNSFSSMWGENGNFKIAKRVPSKCQNYVIHWDVEFHPRESARIRPRARRDRPKVKL